MQSASQRLAYSYASLYLDESCDLTPGDLQVIDLFTRFFTDTTERGGACLLDETDLTTARSVVFEFPVFSAAVRDSGTFADFESSLRERPNRILAHLVSCTLIRLRAVVVVVVVVVTAGLMPLVVTLLELLRGLVFWRRPCPSRRWLAGAPAIGKRNRGLRHCRDATATGLGLP